MLEKILADSVPYLLLNESHSGGQGFRLLWGRFSQKAGFSLDLKPGQPTCLQSRPCCKPAKKSPANTTFTAGYTPGHLRF